MLEKNGKNYTVAWFKLADFITRREKERALGIYRLLMHSFSNKALAYQLKGDILFAFADAQSINAYDKAAKIYESHAKILEAALLYEQLCNSLEDAPSSYIEQYEEYARKVFDLYSYLEHKVKYYECSKRLIKLYCKKQDWLSLEKFKIEHIDNDSVCFQEFHEYIMHCLFFYNIKNTSIIRKYSEILLETYLKNEVSKIKRFLAQIKAYSPTVHKSLSTYEEL